MPHKDPEIKRAYHREYMRSRRAAVMPGPAPVLNHELFTRRRQKAGIRLNPARPYTVESRFPYPAYLVQDGYWFHWETGEMVGAVR